MAANLEKRVDALEREIKSLKSTVRKNKSAGLWWERLAGPSKTIRYSMKW